jgi:hypothetical protein
MRQKRGISYDYEFIEYFTDKWSYKLREIVRNLMDNIDRKSWKKLQDHEVNTLKLKYTTEDDSWIPILIEDIRKNPVAAANICTNILNYNDYEIYNINFNKGVFDTIFFIIGPRKYMIY